MPRNSARKSFRKVMCLVMALALALTLLPVNLTFASGSNVATVFDSLKKLSPTTKNVVLTELWNYGLTQIVDGQELVPEAVVNKVIEVLEDKGVYVVATGTTVENDKISKSTLVAIVEKLLPYETKIAGFYKELEPLVTKTEIKNILGLPANATKVTVLKTLIGLPGPVITTTANGEALSTVSDIKKIITDKIQVLGVPEVIIDAFDLDTTLDTKIQKLTALANEIITDQGMDIDDVIVVLNSFGLYKAPTPQPTTSTPPDTGVVISPTPTPVPEVKDTDAAVKALDQGIKDLEKLTPAEAEKKAAEIIGAIGKVAANTATTAADLNLLAEKIQALADVVMQKAATEAVAPTVTGSAAKATVKDESADAIAKKIEAVLVATKSLNESLDKAGVEVKVKATLTLDLKTTSSVNETVVELGAKILAVAAEKKLDRVAIVTNTATIVVAPSALPKDQGNVVLGAKKLDGDTYDFSVTAGGKAVTTFTTPVEINVPYTLKATDNAKKITVFYVAENGTRENVAGVYDEVKKTVGFTTTHFSKYAVEVNNVTFADLATEAWAKEYVEVMAAKGIIKGLGADTFEPSRNITRAEFAALLVRGFKLSDSTAVNNFSDVSKDDWFAADVAAAAKLGIVKGDGTGTFSPDANITRQDMAVMIARALQTVKEKDLVDTTKFPTSFSDNAKVADYAKTAVATNVRYGIVKGLPDGSFAPVDNATRAEAATIIYRLFFLK